MTDATAVDVLVVTLCAAERAASIRRVVATTLSQQGVQPNLIFVVNGQRFDPDLLAWLRREPSVTVLYQEIPSIFVARRRAREAVTAPCFGFLDDDDYLLDGALATRAAALAADPSADVIVSNGHLWNGSADEPMLPDIDAVRRDPLSSLLDANWLATASALFRTRSIPAPFFDVSIRSNDMTFLAFRLALEKKVAFVATPTYRKSYSSDSISLSDDWALPSLATLEKMQSFPVPASIRRRLRRKCTCAAHEISDVHRRRGQRDLAWRYHLKSLAEPWGLFHYALYTRRLFFATPS